MGTNTSTENPESTESPESPKSKEWITVVNINSFKNRDRLVFMTDGIWDDDVSEMDEAIWVYDHMLQAWGSSLSMNFNGSRCDMVIPYGYMPNDTWVKFRDGGQYEWFWCEYIGTEKAWRWSKLRRDGNRIITESRTYSNIDWIKKQIVPTGATYCEI